MSNTITDPIKMPKSGDTSGQSNVSLDVGLVDGLFSASSKNRWIIGALVLMCVLLGLKVFGLFSGQDSTPRLSVTVPEFKSDTSSHSDGPSLASLINSPARQISQDVPDNFQPVLNRPNEFSGIPPESLTPEQRARRLLLAKQQSEFAAQASQARIAQLDRALLPAQDELESLVRVEVGYVLERWREAWSNGDIDRYLGSYSDDFTPANNLSINAWEANRRSRVKPQRGISVDLSDFNISMLEELNSGVVEFNQRYQSGNYIENSRKRLNLSKEGGDWKIISEVELN